MSETKQTATLSELAAIAVSDHDCPEIHKSQAAEVGILPRAAADALMAAEAMIHSLCIPPGSPGHRDWVMSIPARPNYDPDLVIANALNLLAGELRAVIYERDALNRLIDMPSTADFLESVKLEAAHQRQHIVADHDAGKADSEWFWLIGYLAGKALSAPTMEKRLHHVITTAAACFNWHRHVTGEATGMRPGISRPEGDAA
jgi:hypothetical protein